MFDDPIVAETRNAREDYAAFLVYDLARIVSHEHLLEFLQKRISDPRLLKLITKFLNAGVMIEGRREDTDEGVPQGSVLSPMKSWLRSKLTTPIAELWPILNQKLQGHYQYYGINDNWPWLMKYLKGVQRLVFRWMRRRSQKGKSLSHSSFWQYRDRHPFALPRKLTDLIANYR